MTPLIMFSINPIVTPFPYCHKDNITFMTPLIMFSIIPIVTPFPYCHKDNITFMTTSYNVLYKPYYKVLYESYPLLS